MDSPRRDKVQGLNLWKSILRMELLCVLRERVDTIGGSWHACKEALQLVAQLSMTGRQIAEKRGEFLKAILERWPLAGDFLTMQHTWSTGCRLFLSIANQPLGRVTFLHTLMGTADTGLPAVCGLRACSRLVGKELLGYPVMEGAGLQTDLYGYLCPDHTTPGHPVRLRGLFGMQILDKYNLSELASHLWGHWHRHHHCRIYSFRKKRMVDLEYGLLACSKSCYDDIVKALAFWENEWADRQVVVITTTHHKS